MSLFYKIKHFLTSTREQFFVNQFSKGGNRILSVTRTRDFKKFFWNQFIERDDFRVFIYKFSKDLIHVKVSVLRIVSPGVEEITIHTIKIDEIETFNPEFENVEG